MLLLAVLLLQDPVQDPASGWKDFGPGSWVRVKSVTKLDEKTENVAESKLTLLERTREALVFENETTVLRDVRRERKEIPLKPAKGPVLKMKESSRGEEDLDINGKLLKCRWVENEVETTENGATTRSVSRVWFHAEIPGGIAKMRLKVLQPNPFELELVAIGYEKK